MGQMVFFWIGVIRIVDEVIAWGESGDILAPGSVALFMWTCSYASRTLSHKSKSTRRTELQYLYTNHN